MFYLTYILKFIVYRLYDSSLSQKQFIIEIHQGILHILFDLCYQMQVINKQHIKKVLTDISSVCKEFPKELFCELLVFQGFSIIYITRG